MGEEAERQTALIARLIGLEVPAELVPPGEDPERLRESFFSALRAGIEAMASRPAAGARVRGHPLGRRRHARRDRAPRPVGARAADAGLPGARRAARPPSDLGRRARLGHQARARAADRGGDASRSSRRCCPPARRCPRRSSSAPAATRCSPRRWRAGSPRTGTSRPAELPDTVQAVLAARLDALEPFERRLVQQAAVVGRTFWEGSLAPLAGSDQRRARAGADLAPGEGHPRAGRRRARLAGERELAFKHVLIRDVAYGMLPKAVRARKHFEVGQLHRGARRRPHRRGRLAARRALRPRGGARPRGRAADGRARQHAAPGDALPRGGRRRRRAPVRQPRGRVALPARAPDLPAGRPPGRRADRREAGRRRRCASAAWTRRSRSGSSASTGTAREEDLERVADLHRKIGAALSHKGERKAAIEHYQKGINLLKDGPPRLELVRLYEEAAWLYLHTGDNMLAIYASEKALRLAERLGETRAASRAHGIFGRVFGRIGDTEKARQNLERAVELARAPRNGNGSGASAPREDQSETILALSALGRHLEVSEADIDAARAAYEEALALAEQMGSLPGAGGAARLAGAAGGLRRRLGAGRALDRGERRAGRARGPGRQALPPDRAARAAALARGRTSTRPPCCSTAPTSWPSRSAGPSSPSRRCSGWRPRCATRATWPARRSRSTARSTSASAPA